MLSAMKRALARYFPRTTEYLRAEREAADQLRKPTPRAKKPANGGKAKAAGTKKAAAGDGPAKPEKPADEGIYAGARMKATDAQLQAMRERVAQAVAAGVVSPPSDEQWAMILGRAPLTRIFAGAGSGKSTTLVLRVVFMLCHMGVAPERLTVISFTNASCAQLREQLLKVLAFWQFPFDTTQARQCVRTFHSAMGTLAKELLGNPRWFEQLDDTSAGELDNPLLAGRLRPAQQRLLQQAYQDCFAADAGFRERVHDLLGLPPLPAPVEGQPVRIPKAPMDSFKLAGEFTPLPLFEAFYVQAGFMESIGIRVDRLPPRALACSARERTFVEALALFWKHFEARLQQQGLMTFNAAFQRLGEMLAKGNGLPGAALAPFCHLLIDEFQDISPQIVQWLQALHRGLARQGEAVSLMAIGDDWQSIYGWRGSSPELFMDFDRHFPSKGKTKKSTVLTLETNYRSIEPILRDGEAVLEGVAFKQAKASKAFKAVQPGDHGVKLVSRFDLKTRLPELVQEIQAQCAHVASRANADRNPVLLLSRRNEPLRQIQAQLDSALPVRAYSIHRAKGLQGEVAIIVDDCAPPEKHPLRNALYAHSGFFRNSYDQAMQDESLRLAYVAITRGVSRVIWYSNKVQGAVEVLARRGHRE
ncbi:DEAD/DEAH box helicase [Pseudomonas sp. JM0905a]|uniref:DEAD/DEAH box helicase n=1 Tax=Pseudomonas sp. JM0905a TaxID=2772484 RepID=UPI00168374B7|nr:DEAD/DEAH box helicase [Pseudomonas sp. JM0905a]MBD2838777.1 DEAD/DEAH box helicase [Pseudomonas sp. JM0905a]